MRVDGARLFLEHVFETEFGEVTSVQLLHFTDASEDGYGGETYLLQQNLHSHLHKAFFMGKSRVFLSNCLNISRSDDPEAKVSVLVNATPSPEVLDATTRRSNHFSSWLSLKRSVAWIWRLNNLLLSLNQKRKHLDVASTWFEYFSPWENGAVKDLMCEGLLLLGEAGKAEKQVITFCQQKRFLKEFAYSTEEQRHEKK